MSSHLKYLSICSGIEAATVAWEPLGFQAAAFSEIENFARELLKFHYPDIPLHGDFTTIKENDYGAVDVVVGGTPCQSFSTLGAREGLQDERGQLALEYIRLLERKKPKWVVWENVQGVLQSNEGRDFGAFLASLGQCGYGFAYRVLNAKYFGVPQSRPRVFVVGCFGDWQSAAKVLFESEAVPLHIGKRTEKRKKNGYGFTGSLRESSKQAIARCLAAGNAQKYCAHSECTLIIETGENNKIEIRRLTPIECERLQGFPDNYTKIHEKASDSARLKAIGNSMAVPVMRWIGERIQKVEADLLK